MANNFKRYTSASVTTEATVHTAPVSTETTVIGLSLANTGASAATASVKLGTIYVIKDAPIPVGGALVVVGGDQKLVMNAGDLLKVSSDITVDVITSVLEIT